MTKLFWDLTPPEKRKFVADPAAGSNHNRGCAVDVLDDNPRRSRLWTWDDGPSPRRPGLETLFPTGAWPAGADRSAGAR